MVVEISNVQSEFRQFFEIVKLRNEQHMSEVQPKLATGTDIQPTEEFMRETILRKLFNVQIGSSKSSVHCWTHRWKSFLTSIFGEIAERNQFVEAS